MIILHHDLQREQMLTQFDRLIAKKNDPIFLFQYSQVLRYVVSFLVSVIMVKSALPPDDLGHYEIFFFMATSLTFFWSSGIVNALFAWTPKMDAFEKDKFISQAIWLVTTVNLILCVVVVIFSKHIFEFFSLTWSLNLLWLLIIYIFVSVPVILIDAILYLQVKTKSLLRYTHWSQALLLMVVLLISLYKPDIQVFIIGVVIVYVARYLYLVFYLINWRSGFLQWAKVKPFLVFSGPLVVTVLLGYGMDMIDGWFVTHYFDASYFPIFKYGAREMPLSVLLFSSLSVAMIPLISQSGTGTILLKQKVTNLMHWLFPLSGVLMVISPIVFPLAYSPVYSDAAFIFNIYLLVLVSRVLLPQAICLAHHRTQIVVWSGILEIIVNVVLSFWWMQYWGIFGLAMATVVAYFVQKVMLIIYIQTKLQIKLSEYLDLKVYLVYSSSLIALFMITFNYMR